MKKIIVVSFTFSLVITSCKKDERPTYIPNSDSTIAQKKPTNPNNTNGNSLLQQATVPSANQPYPQQVVVQPTTNNANVANATGPNPEHGKPGHRCDIPVGAPLNSPPGKPGANQQNAIQVSPNSMTKGNAIQIDPNSLKPNKIKTTPGMNPPHGEPGHRCDIPVGKPLNSKPEAQAVSVTNTPQNAIQPPVVQEAPKENPPIEKK